MIPPQPGEAFDWTATCGRTTLVCRQIQALARHVFTTRPWLLGEANLPGTPTGWADVANAMGVEQDRLLRVHQVHGADVVVQAAGRPIIETTDADIIVSNDPSVALAVQMADCVPLLMTDMRTGCVAAAHAGWRGIALRVPLVTVAALVDEFDSHPSDLVAAIGPSIGSCCYEVGDEVRHQFDAAGFSEAELDRWFLEEPRGSVVNPSLADLSRSPRLGHWFLDMWIAVRDQLTAAGVPRDQVFAAQLCTASHADVFCSYRRDGSGAGRMAAAIRKLEGKSYF